MSARISGVKNFESKATSLLRGLPLSQLQSQSEKGAIFSFFTGAAAVESLDACAADRAGAALAVAAPGSRFTGTTAAAGAGGADPGCVDPGCGVAARLFSSASSCSMRTFITASSLAISAEVSGSGLAVGRAEGGAVLFVALVSSGDGSCRAATLG